MALDQAFQNKYKEFKREELGIDDDSSFWEGAQKGYKQFQLSIDKTMLASQNEQILDLENKIAGKSDDEIVSVGGTFMPRQGITVGAENKTVKQVKQDLYIKKNEILKNLDETGKQEFDLQFFKEAEGYGLSDIPIMAGEQLIQIPVAALTFGVGVFAQEYGNAYFDTIYAKLEAEGKDKVREVKTKVAAKTEFEARFETVSNKLGFNNTNSDERIEELNAKIDALTDAVAKLAAKKA